MGDVTVELPDAGRRPTREPRSGERGRRSCGKDRVGTARPAWVGKNDTKANADYLAAKIMGLRIIDAENGKINLSLAENSSAVLSVSQLTLYGDVR